MNFKKATDIVLSPIDHAELAEALGASVAAIRQARLAPSAKAYRSPPKGWQRAVVKLARKRVSEYETLIEEITKSEKPAMGIKNP